MQGSVKILIAPDSFKDCLPALKVAEYLAEGISEKYPEAVTVIFPLADGGDGTASCISFHLGGKWKSRTVNDPLFRPVHAEYLLLEQDNTAVIELARASGLELLKPGDRNALETSTFGTGELIRDALDEGIKRIILTIGGSATVDGGTGIASALGFRFIDRKGKRIARISGGMLSSVARVHTSDLHPLFRETVIEIACDVQNILNGDEGAARVYGPQKGADAAAVEILERGLRHISDLVIDETGFDADKHPGTGAAGGAPLFLLSFGRGSLRKGFETVSELTGFLKALEECDIVITGEGKIDRQTAWGKVVSSVSRMAAVRNKPVYCVGGIIEGNDKLMKDQLSASGLYSIRSFASSDDDSIGNAPEYLRKIGSIIGKEISPQIRGKG